MIKIWLLNIIYTQSCWQKNKNWLVFLLYLMSYFIQEYIIIQTNMQMKIAYWFLLIYNISQNYWYHSWSKPLPRGKSKTSLSFKYNVMDPKGCVQKLSCFAIRKYILLRTVVHKHFQNHEIFLSKPCIMKHSQVKIFI